MKSLMLAVDAVGVLERGLDGMMAPQPHLPLAGPAAAAPAAVASRAAAESLAFAMLVHRGACASGVGRGQAVGLLDRARGLRHGRGLSAGRVVKRPAASAISLSGKPVWTGGRVVKGSRL